MIRTKVKLDAVKVEALVRELDADPSSHATADSPRFDNVEDLVAYLHKPKRGRPSSGKVVVSIRLDPAVIAKFKAARPEGWQALINDVLMAAKL